MDDCEYSLLWHFLQTVPDPRDRRGCRYTWPSLLGLLSVALLAGQKTVLAMAQWVALHTAELPRSLVSQDGRIPSSATFYRVLRRVGIAALEASIGAYGEAVVRQEALSGRVQGNRGQAYRGQALDGKTVCGARAHGKSCHLLSLVCHETGITLGQQQVGDKTNEIPVSLELLRGRDLRGTVITMDALLTQRKLAQQILRQGGHYVMAVKANQGELYKALEACFAASPWPKAQEDRESYSQTQYCHGRQEQRSLTTSIALQGYLDWPGVQQVIQRVCQRSHQGHCLHREVHYGITSLSREQADPEQLETLWRGHWTIENRVHYVRDETMGEDRMQAYVGHTPQAFAALRNAILIALRQQHWPNIAAALRYYNARPKEAFLLLGIPVS